MTENQTGDQHVVAALSRAMDGLDRLSAQAPRICDAANMIIRSLRSGGKIMFCGNGGSAAHAQHLAAELTGRFMKDRDGLPAMALTADTSVITAVANDFGYERVFARQVGAIGRAGDVLVAMSTSGNSRNIVAALKCARGAGIATLGLTGRNGGAMDEFCDLCIRAPAERADDIQQLHITIGHILCGLIEEAVTGEWHQI